MEAFPTLFTFTPPNPLPSFPPFSFISPKAFQSPAASLIMKEKYLLNEFETILNLIFI